MKAYLIALLLITLFGSFALTNAKRGATRESLSPSYIESSLDQP